MAKTVPKKGGKGLVILAQIQRRTGESACHWWRVGRMYEGDVGAECGIGFEMGERRREGMKRIMIRVKRGGIS